MGRHRTAVKEIAASAREFYERKEPCRTSRSRSTNTTRPKGITRSVDISALRHVLAVNKFRRTVNKFRRTVLVESSVAMDGLIEATLLE